MEVDGQAEEERERGGEGEEDISIFLLRLSGLLYATVHDATFIALFNDVWGGGGVNDRGEGCCCLLE